MDLQQFQRLASQFSELLERTEGIFDAHWKPRQQAIEVAADRRFFCRLDYDEDAGDWSVATYWLKTQTRHHHPFDALMLAIAKRLDELRAEVDQLEQIRERIGP
ncbi:MAG: hypothetical protein ACYTG0_12515 [Planctomycetota bacterium]